MRSDSRFFLFVLAFRAQVGSHLATPPRKISQDLERSGGAFLKGAHPIHRPPSKFIRDISLNCYVSAQFN